MTLLLPTYSGHLSTRYSAKAGGVDLPLWGRATDTQFSTAYWTAGDIVPQSGCTYEADQSALIEVSLLSALVITAKVYTNDPSGPIIASSIVSGKVQFTLPQDTVAWVIINDVLHQPVVICSRPILAGPSGTVVTYDGSQTAAFSGQTLYFPAGTHTIGQGFPLHANATIHLHRDAWLIGSINVPSTTGGHALRGYGIISGEWAEAIRLSIRSMDYATQLTYSLINGPQSLTNHATIYGVTLLDPPFYATSYGFSVWDRVCVSGFWWGNAQGIFSARRVSDKAASITKCALLTHDDAIDMSEYIGALSTSGNIICALSATFVLAYWPANDEGVRSTSTTDTVICINYWIGDVGSIILGWCDGGAHSTSGGTSDDARAQVVSGVTFSGTRFMGTDIYGVIFDLDHHAYPYGEIAPGDQLGQIRDIVFENITIESVPHNKSILRGKDRWNTVHDVRFNNVTIGGTLLTTANFDTFVDRNQYLYNVFVNNVSLTNVPTTTGPWFLTDVTQSPWLFTPLGTWLGGSQAGQYPLEVVWAGSSTPTKGPIPSIGLYNWAISIPEALDASFLVTISGDVEFQDADSLAATGSVVLSGSTLMTPVAVVNASMDVVVSATTQIASSSTPLSAAPYDFVIGGQSYLTDELPLNYDSSFAFSMAGSISITPVEGSGSPTPPRQRYIPWWDTAAGRGLLAALARIAGRRP